MILTRFIPLKLLQAIHYKLEQQIKAILYPFSEVVYEQHVTFLGMPKVTNKTNRVEWLHCLSLRPLRYMQMVYFKERIEKLCWPNMKAKPRQGQIRLSCIIALLFVANKPFEVVSTTAVKSIWKAILK